MANLLYLTFGVVLPEEMCSFLQAETKSRRSVSR